MFQFPGFALVSLCIHVTSTWFTPLLTTLPRKRRTGPKTAAPQTLQSNNNRVSGGLPHSEIHGSKLILSSPWLIAEYHVLHRLLLPRHSPNALFALDLIQKAQDFPIRSHFSRPGRWFATGTFLVSVLDLEQNCLRGRTPRSSHTRVTSNSDVYLSIRCQCRPVGRSNARSVRLMVKLLVLLVERIGIEPMTPCLQSRCSPS